MKTAAIYARYSSDLQRSESIDAQIRACRYYAQRFDLDVVRVYSDAAKSGRSTARRDQFSAMMDDALAGRFEVLLVHKLSRFSRSGTDTLNNKAKLETAGVELISVTERLDNTPEGKLMLYVITGMNEFYSANLAAETMKGLRENAYNGRHTGGLPPLGYDVDPATKRLVINEEEAKAVRTIFAMYLAGGGYGDITRTLNANGWRTKRGALFGRNSIHDILINEKYTGVLTYDKIAAKTPDGKMNRRKFKNEYIRIEGGCPQIISKEDFERTAIRLKNNQHRPRPATVENYILSGKLYCGECGHRMCGERHKVRDIAYAYYTCNEGKRRKNHRLSAPKELVEDMVCNALNKMLSSPEAVDAIARAAVASYEDDASANDRLDKEIALCDTGIRNIVKAITSGLDEPELRTEMARLKQRKAELLAIQSTVAHDSKKSYEDWKLFLFRFCDIKTLPEMEKKALIQTYIARVLLFRRPGPDGGKGSAYEIEIELNPNNVEYKEGSGLPLPKRKDTLRRVFPFCFCAAARRSTPRVIEMLGRSESVLRQGFRPWGETACTCQSADSPGADITILPFVIYGRLPQRHTLRVHLLQHLPGVHLRRLRHLFLSGIWVVF